MSHSAESFVSRILTDRLSPEWKLLADTEGFLSYTDEASEYEDRFRAWRKRLANPAGSDKDLITLRSELVALRRELRLKGYDLSLAGKRLVMSGFRDDDAVAEGFTRAVVCFTDTGTFTLQGQANHIEIADCLERDIQRAGIQGSREWHFLWVRRDARGLTVSGSATETAADFARLRARAEANPMKILSQFSNLR